MIVPVEDCARSRPDLLVLGATLVQGLLTLLLLVLALLSKTFKSSIRVTRMTDVYVFCFIRLTLLLVHMLP